MMNGNVKDDTNVSNVSETETETDAKLLEKIRSSFCKNRSSPAPAPDHGESEIDAVKVKVKNGGEANFEFDEEYEMGYPSRGTAVIFNNNVFNPNLNLPKNRRNKEDCDRLKRSLVLLGFEEKNIRIYNDFTRLEILRISREVAEEYHEQSDCILIAILTYGKNDLIFGSDGWFKIELLWEPFAANRCKTLAEKPKLFFIQARERPRVVSFDTVDSKPVSAEYKIPSFADFFIAHSTITDDGPWFIQRLCDTLDEFGSNVDQDIANLLTIANQKISIDIDNYNDSNENPERRQKMQIPCLMSMLTKKVFFKPKETKTETKVEIETAV